MKGIHHDKRSSLSFADMPPSLWPYLPSFFGFGLR